MSQFFQFRPGQSVFSNFNTYTNQYQDKTKALHQGRLAEKIINNPITNEDKVEEAWKLIKKHLR